MCSLVIAEYLYAGASWNLTEEKSTQTLEVRCFQRLLNMSYKDHGSNGDVRRRSKQPVEN